MFASQIVISLYVVTALAISRGNVEFSNGSKSNLSMVLIFVTKNKRLGLIPIGFMLTALSYIFLTYLYAYSEVLGDDRTWLSVQSMSFVPYSVMGYLSVLFSRQVKRSKNSHSKKEVSTDKPAIVPLATKRMNSNGAPASGSSQQSKNTQQ